MGYSEVKLPRRKRGKSSKEHVMIPKCPPPVKSMPYEVNGYSLDKDSKAKYRMSKHATSRCSYWQESGAHSRSIQESVCQSCAQSAQHWFGIRKEQVPCQTRKSCCLYMVDCCQFKSRIRAGCCQFKSKSNIPKSLSKFVRTMPSPRK
jgi:hypothetical protein